MNDNAGHHVQADVIVRVRYCGAAGFPVLDVVAPVEIGAPELVPGRDPSVLAPAADCGVDDPLSVLLV